MPFPTLDVCKHASLNSPVISEHEHLQNFDDFSINVVCHLIHQLEAVCGAAGCIFDEVLTECCTIRQKTQQLHKRFVRLEKSVKSYNPKRVRVPEEDFENVKNLKNFRSERRSESQLFTAARRPAFVSSLYEKSVVDPDLVLESSMKNQENLSKSVEMLSFFNQNGLLGNIPRRYNQRKQTPQMKKMPSIARFSLRRKKSEDSAKQLRPKSLDGLCEDDHNARNRFSSESRIPSLLGEDTPQIISSEMHDDVFSRPSTLHRTSSYSNDVNPIQKLGEQFPPRRVSFSNASIRSSSVTENYPSIKDPSSKQSRKPKLHKGLGLQQLLPSKLNNLYRSLSIGSSSSLAQEKPHSSTSQFPVTDWLTKQRNVSPSSSMMSESDLETHRYFSLPRRDKQQQVTEWKPDSNPYCDPTRTNIIQMNRQKSSPSTVSNTSEFELGECALSYNYKTQKAEVDIDNGKRPDDQNSWPYDQPDSGKCSKFESDSETVVSSSTLVASEPKSENPDVMNRHPPTHFFNASRYPASDQTHYANLSTFSAAEGPSAHHYPRFSSFRPEYPEKKSQRWVDSFMGRSEKSPVKKTSWFGSLRFKKKSKVPPQPPPPRRISYESDYMVPVPSFKRTIQHHYPPEIPQNLSNDDNNNDYNLSTTDTVIVNEQYNAYQNDTVVSNATAARLQQEIERDVLSPSLTPSDTEDEVMDEDFDNKTYANDVCLVEHPVLSANDFFTPALEIATAENVSLDVYENAAYISSAQSEKSLVIDTSGLVKESPEHDSNDHGSSKASDDLQHHESSPSLENVYVNDVISPNSTVDSNTYFNINNNKEEPLIFESPSGRKFIHFNPIVEESFLSTSESGSDDSNHFIDMDLKPVILGLSKKPKKSILRKSTDFGSHHNYVNLPYPEVQISNPRSSFKAIVENAVTSEDIPFIDSDEEKQPPPLVTNNEASEYTAKLIGVASKAQFDEDDDLDDNIYQNSTSIESNSLNS